jgi:hypothetical protein
MSGTVLFVSFVLFRLSFKRVELPGSILVEDNTGPMFLVRKQPMGQRKNHINIIGWHYILCELREKKWMLKSVHSDYNESNIRTKNVPEKVQMTMAFSV